MTSIGALQADEDHDVFEGYEPKQPAPFPLLLPASSVAGGRGFLDNLDTAEPSSEKFEAPGKVTKAVRQIEKRTVQGPAEAGAITVEHHPDARSNTKGTAEAVANFDADVVKAAADVIGIDPSILESLGRLVPLFELLKGRNNIPPPPEPY